MRIYNGGHGQKQGRFNSYIFCSPNRDVAGSHGPIITQYDIDEDLLTDANHLAFEDIEDLACVKEFADYHDISIDDVIDLASERTNSFNYALEDLNMDGCDAGEFSWDVQILTADVAMELGYKGVEVEDEHGVSIMINS